MFFFFDDSSASNNRFKISGDLRRIPLSLWGNLTFSTAMDETYSYIMQILKKPSFTETFVDILLCAVPIWLAVMIGLLIGWSWRPRWTGLIYLGFRSKLRFLWTAPPGFGARRLWLAFTALSAFSVCRTVWSRRDTSANKSANGLAPTQQAPGEESPQSDETGSVYYRSWLICFFVFLTI